MSTSKELRIRFLRDALVAHESNAEAIRVQVLELTAYGLNTGHLCPRRCRERDQELKKASRIRGYFKKKNIPF